MIPVGKPSVAKEEENAVLRVLRSGMLAQGPETSAFEQEFARYCGTVHAVAVSSGTAALHATLHALGIGKGHEVIVPSFTFFATASAVCMCGARPRFGDIDPDTFNLSIGSVQDLLSSRTRAVIGVHLFGQPCDARPLREICDDEGIVFIEDAAQAHGAEYHGKRVGGLGIAGCFSFYPTKNMTTGEGGIVTTDDAGLARKVRVFINHGQEEKYVHTSIGYNYRMTDIAAAIGREQLKKLDAFNRRRQETAAYYDAHLPRDGIVCPFTAPGVTHVYHQYVIRVTGGFRLTRDELAGYLRDRGIGTAVHYPVPLHRQPAFAAQARDARCPVAEECAATVLSLPVHPGVTGADRDRVCRTIAEVP
ncbi:MAG: DegT/DnrJ/EryC1/StrS family aminotransferase [Methanolinea sp.]|nr:DegT/DnrJ/EryC1/StrS family aminotransferase [Methanolinea sp.]